MQEVIQKKKQPRILLVASDSKGHVLKFHVPTIKLLTESGWHVDVACAGEDPVPYCVQQFTISYKRSPFNLALFKGIRELKKVIDNGRYDIVYCHTPVGAMAARLASVMARKNGTKVIYMAHGFHFYTGAPVVNWLLFYPVEKALSYITDSIILINQEDFQRSKEKLRHKGKSYLLNGIGIELSRFQMGNKQDIRKEYRDEFDIPQDAAVLVYIADLVPNKNQKMLMRVLKNLLEKGQKSYLVLVGIGDAVGDYVDYAKKLGIENYIRFLGWRNDVEMIYAMADICTASSIREGFGINVVEAMASGIPVVATDNRGHRTINENGQNGFLIPIGDEEQYTERVYDLITDHKLYARMSETAKMNLDKFSMETATLRIKEILTEHL